MHHKLEIFGENFVFKIDRSNICFLFSRASATDFVSPGPTATSVSRGHSRASSTDSVLWATHQSTSSSSHFRQKSGAFIDHHPSIPNSSTASVILLAGHHNWISAAYSNNG